MKAYDELSKLTRKLLEAPNEDAKADAEKNLQEFMSEDNRNGRRVDIEDVVDAFADVVNSSGGRSTQKKFVELVSRKHQTLQQLMTGVMLAYIQHLGELTNYQFDGRLESSVRISRDITSWVKFLDEMNRYHESDTTDAQIRYLEEHKNELEEFIAFVRGFVLNDRGISSLPLV